MLSALQRLPRPVLAALFLAAIATVVVWWKLAASTGSWSELARVNPELEVAESVGGRVLVSDRNGGDPVFMRATDAGPYLAQLTPCSSVVSRMPGWFRLPADAAPTACLEIAIDDGTVLVLNFQASVGIPELWDEFYEPLVSAAGLDYRGGSASGPGVGTSRAPRSLSYTLDGPDGVDDLLSIDAFFRGDITLAVVTLRLRRP